MWIWIVAAIVLFVVVSGMTAAVRTARKHRDQYAEASRLWRQTPADQRAGALSALTPDTEPNGPVWFLIGCDHLHEYRTKQAARAFGIAHHADCNLEAAALLAFACLKAAEGKDSDIVEQIITTWREMKQPDIPRRKQDRLLLSCLESTVGNPPDLPPLGRLIWLVVGPALRPTVQGCLSLLANGE